MKRAPCDRDKPLLHALSRPLFRARMAVIRSPYFWILLQEPSVDHVAQQQLLLSIHSPGENTLNAFIDVRFVVIASNDDA